MAGLTWRDIDPGADTPDRMRRNWQILREVLAGMGMAEHTHTIEDVTGLQAALDGKANVTHSHVIGDVTDLQGELDARLEDAPQDGKVYGRQDGEWVEVAATPSAPAAPSDLLATAASYWRIDLTWSDNSGTEAGFEIQRSEDGESWATLDTVAADVTSYSDADVLPETQYWYRVRATADINSDWSNTATATTPERVYDDEFNDTTIDAKWISVHGTSHGASFVEADGVLTMTDPGGGGDIHHALLQPLLTGDFTAWARVKASANANNYSAWGMIASDTATAGTGTQRSYTIGYINSWCMFTQRVNSFSGGAGSSSSSGLSDPTGQWYYIRVRRSGSDWYFATSTDGETWTELGPVNPPVTPAYLGLMVVRNNVSGSVVADFDYFRLVEGNGNATLENP